MTLHELSLFTGYGGLTLGLRLAGLPVRTIGYCDNEPYIQKLIKARIKDGFLDEAPIIGDIRTGWTSYRGLVDIITAGFPCQPHSHAGRREGEADNRNLWPDTRRCISEVGPRFVLLANVPGIVSNGYAGVVTGELSEIGYDAVWGIVSAADVGAPHLRKRWWCLGVMADTDSLRSREDRQSSKLWTDRTEQSSSNSRLPGEREDGEVKGMADTDKTGLEGWWSDDHEEGRKVSPRSPGLSGRVWPPGPSDIEGWEEVIRERPDLTPALTKEAERQFRGVDDGRSRRVDRLKATGNGVVPAVVAEFLRRSK